MSATRKIWRGRLNWIPGSMSAIKQKMYQWWTQVTYGVDFGFLGLIAFVALAILLICSPAIIDMWGVRMASTSRIQGLMKESACKKRLLTQAIAEATHPLNNNVVGRINKECDVRDSVSPELQRLREQKSLIGEEYDGNTKDVDRSPAKTNACGPSEECVSTAVTV